MSERENKDVRIRINIRFSRTTTYHYDRMRTAWNPNETTLTPGSSGNVKPNSFGVLQRVQLGVATGDTANDYFDAQPASK